MGNSCNYRSHLLTFALLLPLILFTCLAEAAPTFAPLPPQTTAPVMRLPPVITNPNTPPVGTITITSPQRGAGIYTGIYTPIQWTSNGTRSNLVNVTLWANNQLVATIRDGADTGKTAYIFPLEMAAGQYELRVTNLNDNRIEARTPIILARTSYNLVNPPKSLMAGAPYTLSWSYTSGLSTVRLSLIDESGAVVWSEPNVPTGSRGNGSWTVTIPPAAAGKVYSDYRFQINATLPTSVTSNSKADLVLGRSDSFRVQSFNYPKSGNGPPLQISYWGPEGQVGQGYRIRIRGDLVKGKTFMAIGGVQLTPQIVGPKEMDFILPPGLLVPAPGLLLVVYQEGGQVQILSPAYKVCPNTAITKVEPTSFRPGNKVTITGTSLFLAYIKHSYSTTRLSPNSTVNYTGYPEGNFLDIGPNLKIMMLNPVISSSGDSLEFTVGALFEVVSVNFSNGGKGLLYQQIAPQPLSYSDQVQLWFAGSGGRAIGPKVTWNH